VPPDRLAREVRLARWIPRTLTARRVSHAGGQRGPGSLRRRSHGERPRSGLTVERRHGV